MHPSIAKQAGIEVRAFMPNGLPAERLQVSYRDVPWAD
jgi:hypothetical protein